MKRRRVGVGAIAIAAALVVGGVAFATIPDSGGVIHGCYAKSGGALRVTFRTGEDFRGRAEVSGTAASHQ